MKIVSLADLPEEGVSHNPEIRKRVMLRRGDLPHLTNFSRAVLLPGQTASAHAHSDMCEVFFVQSGVGVIRIDGREHRIETGSCISVEPGESHEVANTASSDLVLLYFGIEI